MVRRYLKLNLAQLFIFGLILLSLTLSAQAKIIIPINVPGATNTFATGVNNAGQVVGFYLDAGYSRHGFLLSGGLITTFDVPGAIRTYPTGINDSGQIVGSWSDGSVWWDRGFLRSVGGAFSTLDEPSATTGTYPSGINNAGQIVGEYYIQGFPHGFLLSGSTFTNFDPQGVNGPGFFNGINNNGVILALSLNYPSSDYFLLSGGTYSTISNTNASYSYAIGLNNLNQTVGQYTDKNNNTQYGFLDLGGR